MPVKINSSLCTGCGVCVESCPSTILEVKADICVLTNPADCTDCQSCVATCAAEAIQI